MQFIDMADLGRRLWGEPSKLHSSKGKIRFGTNGSKCIDTEKYTFYDHEAETGGGYADLFEKVHGHRPADTAIAATYQYQDEKGGVLFEVVRKVPKQFVQRRPDGNGGWNWSTKGVRRVPYRLPELLKVPTVTPIYITEGEKDADALRDHLLVATTNPGGAGKWPTSFSPYFRDRHVVILPDNDQAGADHAADVAKKLAGVAASIKILKIEGLPEKGDVSDWLAAGHTVEELERLAVETAPENEPSQEREHRNRQTDRKQKEPPHVSYQELRDQLDQNNNGAILPTHANLLTILKQDPLLAGLVEFNSFSGLHVLRKSVPTLNKSAPRSQSSYPRPWDADDVTRVLAYVQKAWAHNFKKATVEECLLLEGRDNEVHGVRDYLDGLPWDDTARLDSWLAKAFGCPEDNYHKAVGAKMLIAAVRRVRQPGCKFDQMAVLEGPQDLGKSTAILTLFGADWLGSPDDLFKTAR